MLLPVPSQTGTVQSSRAGYCTPQSSSKRSQQASRVGVSLEDLSWTTHCLAGGCLWTLVTLCRARNQKIMLNTRKLIQSTDAKVQQGSMLQIQSFDLAIVEATWNLLELFRMPAKVSAGRQETTVNIGLQRATKSTRLWMARKKKNWQSTDKEDLRFPRIDARQSLNPDACVMLWKTPKRKISN